MSRFRKRSAGKQETERRAQIEARQQPLPLAPAPLFAEQKRRARARLRALARLLAVVEREYRHAAAECERLGLAAGGPEPRSAGPRARGAPQTEAEEPTEALAGNLLTGDHAGADPPSGDIASLLCFLDDLSAALGALPEG